MLNACRFQFWMAYKVKSFKRIFQLPLAVQDLHKTLPPFIT